MLTVLLAVAALELVTLICLMPVSLKGDPVLWRQTQMLLRPIAPRPIMLLAPDPTLAEKRDLAPGTALPDNPVGRAILHAAGRLRVGVLVIYVGDCSSCIGIDLGTWQSRAASRGLKTVLVSDGTAAQARKFHRDLGIDIPVVADPHRVLIRKLNPVFKPRAYLFSQFARLRWSQPSLSYDIFGTVEFSRALESIHRENSQSGIHAH